MSRRPSTRRLLLVMHIVSVLLCADIAITFMGNWIGAVSLLVAVYSVHRIMRIFVESQNA